MACLVQCQRRGVTEHQAHRAGEAEQQNQGGPQRNPDEERTGEQHRNNQQGAHTNIHDGALGDLPHQRGRQRAHGHNAQGVHTERESVLPGVKPQDFLQHKG